MAKSLHIFLLLTFLIHLQTTPAKSDGSDFINAECQKTLYPRLCVECLSNYSNSIQQNHLQLAKAAISVSQTRFQTLSDFVSKLSKMTGMKPMEAKAVKDCKENVGDSLDQLNRSVQELGGMRQMVAGQDFDWHMSNVQTWVSAALTDANTCLYGFAGPTMDGKVKFAIQRRVVDCSQVTSNALALVNRFAARHNRP